MPHTRFHALAALAALTLTAALAGQTRAAPALQALGKGVQIYSCQASGAGFAWTLTGPEAMLTAADGAAIGKHFAGPTWQAADGSTIVGEAVVASPSPQAGAVAWLVLKARSTGAPGLFSGVTYVTRTATEGGAAPAGGCDAGHVGAQTRSPYSATYTFFSGASSPGR